MIRHMLWLLASWAFPLAAMAQQDPSLLRSGFEIHRTQPTPVGESSFLVDSPRFEAGTWSAGISLDYAYRPLVLGVEDEQGEFQQLRVLIQHQLLGNLEVSGAFCGCMTVSASVPLTLLERGPSESSASGSSRALSLRAAAQAEPEVGVVPVSGLGASDPRLSLMVRLYGQPGQSAFSASLGGTLWVPLRKFLDGPAAHTSDLEARMLSKLVLSGRRSALRWSLTGGFLLRPEAHLGELPGPEGSTAGSEAQLGASLQYAHPAGRFAVGPELFYATVVTPRAYAFKPFFSSLDALLGLHVRAGERLRLGVGAGAGLQRQPGTPTFRLLVRMSYDALRASERPPAPVPPPPARERRLVRVPAPAALPPLLIQVPSRETLRASMDQDSDGVLDEKDVCVDTPMGDAPDARRLGCPVSDPDHDSIIDPEDACPDVPGVSSLEPKMNGCPLDLVEHREDRLLTRQPIVFAAGTDVLLSENYQVLQALARAIQDRPWIQELRIEGHTDNSGNVDFNNLLSLRRAESVKRWLVEHGIDAGRLRTAGYGPSRPIADNATPIGRAANRRVDFIIAVKSP